MATGPAPRNTININGNDGVIELDQDEPLPRQQLNTGPPRENLESLLEAQRVALIRRKKEARDCRADTEKAKAELKAAKDQLREERAAARDQVDAAQKKQRTAEMQLELAKTERRKSLQLGDSGGVRKTAGYRLQYAALKQYGESLRENLLRRHSKCNAVKGVEIVWNDVPSWGIGVERTDVLGSMLHAFGLSLTNPSAFARWPQFVFVREEGVDAGALRVEAYRLLAEQLHQLGARKVAELGPEERPLRLLERLGGNAAAMYWPVEDASYDAGPADLSADPRRILGRILAKELLDRIDDDSAAALSLQLPTAVLLGIVNKPSRTGNGPDLLNAQSPAFECVDTALELAAEVDSVAAEWRKTWEKARETPISFDFEMRNWSMNVAMFTDVEKDEGVPLSLSNVADALRRGCARLCRSALEPRKAGLAMMREGFAEMTGDGLRAQLASWHVLHLRALWPLKRTPRGEEVAAVLELKVQDNEARTIAREEPPPKITDQAELALREELFTHLRQIVSDELTDRQRRMLLTFATGHELLPEAGDLIEVNWYTVNHKDLWMGALVASACQKAITVPRKIKTRDDLKNALLLVCHENSVDDGFTTV